MWYRDGRLIPESEVTADERALANTPATPAPQEDLPPISGIEESLTDDIEFTKKSIDPLPNVDEEVKELEKVLDKPVAESKSQERRLEAQGNAPLETTEPEKPVQPDTRPPLNLTGCVFCGAPKEHARGVNYKGSMIEVPMCGGCYHEKTLGETMQKLNQRG